jgi:hypothetical protein
MVFPLGFLFGALLFDGEMTLLRDGAARIPTLMITAAPAANTP